MRTRWLSLSCVLVGGSFALTVAAPALAAPSVCEIAATDVSAGTFEPLCEPPMPCLPGDPMACTDTGFSDPVCGTAFTDLPTICRPHCGTVLGCGGDADCRPFRDALGFCRLVGIDMDPPFAVCVYPSLGVTYCGTAGSLDAAAFARCHTTTTGMPTSNYFEGNCDGDACPNGGDSDPCFSDRLPCVDFDRTLACGVAMPPDAGVPDGGNVIDAGALPIDASVTRDAGSTEPADAGVAEPFDANTIGPVSFGGGGGCRCGVGASTPARSSVAGLLTLGLAVAVRVRRSRSRV